jgi:hypothetical protein
MDIVDRLSAVQSVIRTELMVGAAGTFIDLGTSAR